MIRTTQYEVRGKKITVLSYVWPEPSARIYTAPLPEAGKAEANGALHADEGCTVSLKEIEGIITDKIEEVRAFVEDTFFDLQNVLERKEADQANVLIEILRSAHACKTPPAEPLGKPRYRHGRRTVALSKALARNRRFRATAQGGEHG